MTIEIYSDGACLNNPGNGAWCAIIIDKEKRSINVISGFTENTTNNRMELYGAMKSLDFIMREKLSNKIKIFTDSQYVKNGITTWIHNWHKNNWITAAKQPVKNQELWIELHKLNSKIIPEWLWVKGHSDNLFNNIVDVIANQTARTQKILSIADIKILISKLEKSYLIDNFELFAT